MRSASSRETVPALRDVRLSSKLRPGCARGVPRHAQIASSPIEASRSSEPLTRRASRAVCIGPEFGEHTGSYLLDDLPQIVRPEPARGAGVIL